MTDIEDLHQLACNNKHDTYIDPETGCAVFTKHAHLKRGSCCGRKCRHCPYDWINVKTKNIKSNPKTGI